MKKSIYIFFLILAACISFGSCTSDDIAGTVGTQDEENREGTRISFAVDGSGILTSTDIEPMTRADELNVARIENNYCILVLRKMDETWIVEDVYNEMVYNYYNKDTGMPILWTPDPSEIYDNPSNPEGTYVKSRNFSRFYVTPELLRWDKELILREGDYRIVIVINSNN